MNNQQISNNPEIANFLNFALWIAAFVAVLYISHLYLIGNFSYSGESYYKGSGHLLKEDMSKGILFLSLRHLFTSIIVAYLIFLSIGKKTREKTIRIVTIVWLVILLLPMIYLGIKIYDVQFNNYDRIDRIIQIGTIWIFRTIGLILGYLLVKKNVGLKRVRKITPANKG